MAIPRSSDRLVYFVLLLISLRVQANMNQLSLNLYQLLKLEENLCFSPASIGIGLSMVLMGSRNKTAEQIKILLGYDDEELIKNVFKKFITRHKGSAVTNTNGIFVDSDLKILDEYLSGLEYYYESGVSFIDFKTNYELGRKEINSWIYKKTNGMISDLFPPDSISSLTALVIVNTIYFKGLWANRFDPSETWIGSFTISPTGTVETHMMHVKSVFAYGEFGDLGCQVVELPYENSGLSMILFLPNDKSGLKNMEKKLTIEALNLALTSLIKQKVEVTVPKFKVSNGFSMKEYLIQLTLALWVMLSDMEWSTELADDVLRGLADAMENVPLEELDSHVGFGMTVGVQDLFDGRCDLSGIAKGDLSVSDMFHKSVIEVNEEGTEAAAATGKVISKRSLEMIPEFIADHPFIFLVYDRIAEIVLFMGKLTRPESVNRKKEL